MALKQATLDKLKSTFKGLDVDKLITAIKAEDEQDVDIPEVKVFTDTELASREESVKNSGIKVGKEIAIKELKETVGLDYDGEGSKDPKKFVSEYQKKVLTEANIKESDRIKEKEAAIEQLRLNIEKLTNEKNDFLRKSKEAEIDGLILSSTIDKKPDNLTNAEWLAVIKLNNQIEEHEGQLVVKREGKIVQNQTDLKAIPVKDALLSFIDERKLGKVEQQQQQQGGRGAGDSKVSALGIVNMKQFKEHAKSQGISENGEKAQALLAEIVAANPNFSFAE